jgi:GW (Gly-Tryp) dipeptide domain
MIKRGQCSNNPTKCSNAANNVLLAYAGPKSICPECGAPLALVAVENSDDNISFQSPNPAKSDDYFEEKSTNGMLDFVKTLAIIAVLGGAVFVGLKFFTSKNNAQDTNFSEQLGNQTVLPTNGFEQLSAPIIVKSNGMVEVKTSPSMSSESIATLGQGMTMDVEARGIVDGIEWLKVIIPNHSGQIGYVRAAEVSPLGDGMYSGMQDGMMGMPSNMVGMPPVAAPPVIGPIVTMTDTIFYVQSDKANLRTDAGANAPKSSEAMRGETLNANASRTVGGKTWYRVTTKSGESAWVAASTLGKAPPAPKDETAAVDAVVGVSAGANVVFVADKIKVKAADPTLGEDEIEARKDMVVQVDATEIRNGVTWYHIKSKRFNMDGWVDGRNVKAVE